jgi:hypothetical protein
MKRAASKPSRSDHEPMKSFHSGSCGAARPLPLTRNKSDDRALLSATCSGFQLALQLIEKAPIRSIGDDYIRALLNEPDFL